MKRHRTPENEILNQTIKEAAGALLDEEWNSAGECEPAPELRERVMKAAEEARKKRAMRRKCIRIGQYAAMVVLVCGVILFCIPTVRAGFVDAVITWYDDCFRVEFHPGDEKSGSGELPDDIAADFGWLPDGYTLTDAADWDGLIRRASTNADGDRIILDIGSDSAVSLYDTQFGITELVVAGQPGYYLRHTVENCAVLTWAVDQLVYNLCAYSPEITRDMLIRIAENLK